MEICETKVALVVPKIIPCDKEANLLKIQYMLTEASEHKADLVVFPEAVITGLANNDDPEHDLPLGESIPGLVTDMLSNMCFKRRIWLAIGLIEVANGSLFDTAILINPKGEIQLKYRRIQLQWHGKDADPAVYKQGTETPFGSVCFLICGDLFEDRIIDKVRCISPDWILYLLARNFSEGIEPQQEWENVEKQIYVDRMKLTGTITFMTNYLVENSAEGGAFGGAMIVDGSGVVLASFPVCKEGILYWNFLEG